MLVEYREIFFFNDTATTEIYTLSLHDALPISGERRAGATDDLPDRVGNAGFGAGPAELGDEGQQEHGVGVHQAGARSEEHTSELQSRQYLVCRLLLEKKKNNIFYSHPTSGSA